MSMLTPDTLPVQTVRTHGALHGVDIPSSAKTAADIAAEIARNPRSRSAVALAQEEIARATARLAKSPGKKTASKLVRIERNLRKLGVDTPLAVIAAG